MAGYTRQSSINDNDTITAAIFNNEYNQLLAAFNNTSGHKHDGTAAEGPVIALIGDAGLSTPLNKIQIDTTNDTIDFSIDVSGTSTEQFNLQDGAIVPTTDNDIDLGTSSLEFKDAFFDGTVTLDGLVIGSATSITDVDTDLTAVSASDDTVASAKAIKTYVDAQVTASDLDFSGDAGGSQSIDLDSQSLTLTGGTGIDTTGSAQTMTFAIDNTVATLAGSQTLTNKVIDIDNNTLSNVEVDNLKSGVLDTDITSVSGSDDTLASAKAIKTYVDAQVATIPVGDITSVVAGAGMTGGGTSGAVTLDVVGGTGITANANDIAIDSSVVTLTGSQALSNKTGNISQWTNDVGYLTSETDSQTLSFSTPTLTISNGNNVNLSTLTNGLITASSTDTLTNKTIDADGTGNSITNIEDANIKAAAAIDATKIADGSVTNSEFQFINSLSSNAQTQIDSKQATIDSSARLNANLVGDGSVDNTEFGYINGVTSAIQTQINTANTNIATKASAGFAVAMAIAL